MNAALIQLSALLHAVVGIRAARRNEVVGRERLTLRSDHRIAGELIQQWHDASAELLDLGEGVHFTTAIHREERRADAGLDGGRCEPPGVDGTMLRELLDEARELDAARARASSRAQHGIERRGIARIEHLDAPHSDVAALAQGRTGERLCLLRRLNRTTVRAR